MPRVPIEWRRSGEKRLVFQVPPWTDMLGNPGAEIAIDIPVQAVANDSTALAKHIARLLAAHPGWQHVGTVDKGTLPPSRVKRNAWRWDGTQVTDQP